MANTKLIEKYDLNEILALYLAKILNLKQTDFEIGRGSELANRPSDGFVNFEVVDLKNDVHYCGCANHDGIMGVLHFEVGYYQYFSTGIEMKKYHHNTKQVKELNQKLKELGSIHSYVVNDFQR